MMFPSGGSCKCRKCGYVKGKEDASAALISKSSREKRDVTVLEGTVD